MQRNSYSIFKSNSLIKKRQKRNHQSLQINYENPSNVKFFNDFQDSSKIFSIIHKFQEKILKFSLRILVKALQECKVKKISLFSPPYLKNRTPVFIVSTFLLKINLERNKICVPATTGYTAICKAMYVEVQFRERGEQSRMKSRACWGA